MVDRSIPCRLHCRRMRAAVSLDALSEVFAECPSSSILGGNAAVVDNGGLSYWAAEPRDVFEFTAAQTNPFLRLENTLNRYELADECVDSGRESHTPSGMFAGGWIGYFSYELGRHIERLPEKAFDDLHLPLIRLCFYDRLIAYDHHSDVFWLVVLELPDDSESPQDKIASLERRLHQAQQIQARGPFCGDIESPGPADIRRNMSQQDYLDAVVRIKKHIRDGDVYQVNLSHRMQVPFHGRPVQLFHWQNHHNPSGHAAYLDAGDFQVVSASPEMFITLHDGLIQTKPIKGTRPRITDSHPDARRLNAQQFHDLLTSEKEQAELNMIVDLERNDIAEICKPGTRRVIQPRTIEVYPTVFHAVATIAGQLRDEIAFSDVLRAMFPGGSITGAPKIRSMEIIEELEPTVRGVYTGAIGFVGLDRTARLNIAIRTIIIASDSAFVQAGGGIVADSDPHEEWKETMVKARALLAGIQAVETERIQGRV